VLINGVDARATYGFAMDNSPGWMDAPPRQTPNAQVLRRAPRVLDKPRDQAWQFTIRGTIMGTSASDARTKSDALKLALCKNAGAQLVFDDTPTRYVTARCEGFRVPPSGASMIQNRLSVEATMVAYDPFMYDLADAATLFWYDPGDTIPGETYLRSGTANQFDANGILQAVAADKRRDAHYINGVRTTLMERGTTNNATTVRDLTNTGTWVGAQMSRNLDQVGIDGTPNSATRLTAQAANATILCTLTISSSTRVQSAFIRRASGIGTVEMTQDGGTTWTLLPTPPAGGPWVRVSIPPQTLVNPVIGFRLATSGSQVIVDYVQNEAGTDVTSPIIGTRSTEGSTSPWVYPPSMPLTLYAKYIEQSTDTPQRRFFEIGNNEPAATFIVYGSAGNVSAYHNNGSSPVSAALSSGAVAGDTVELRAVYRADGSVYIGVSKNGGTETVSAPSAALAPAPAWSTQSFRMPVSGSGTNIAMQTIRIARGDRSLAQMRAATKPATVYSDTTNALPLGTGPVRPVLTINGAATNPTITLYNNQGAAVGAMALTVTTSATDVLVIDSDAKTIQLNGVNHLDYITTGDFFTIDPEEPGYDGAGPSFATTSGALSVSYRRAWR